MIRRRRRVGAKARARIRAGGPTSVHRSALSRHDYAALRLYVIVRDGRQCVVCGSRRGPLDVDHVVPRSRGGADDPSNLLTLCRPHHRQKEAPYARGRLVITALGSERFDTRIVFARDKWEARARELGTL